MFFRDGFMRANLDEMAEKAGVAKGTLYRYFESKADLYVAVLALNNQEIFDEQMKAACGAGRDRRGAHPCKIVAQLLFRSLDGVSGLFPDLLGRSTTRA